jgi:surfactin synthase thioesterase subunit
VPFAKSFSSDVKCIAVRYPGRRGTHDLASFTSISDLAERACQLLAPGDQVDGKVAFFGHSMGALVAFDVARRFEAAGKPIAALFVSACAAPGEIGYDYIPESDRGLLDAVSAMTGANPEFLENEESRRRFCPHFAGSRPLQITSAHPTRPCHALSSLSWVMTTESPPTKK